jgi:methylenetetrahydrofolate dehydrogenase (NADP+)/methenyltetrahydrofolate cyclohydrolase
MNPYILEGKTLKEKIRAELSSLVSSYTTPPVLIIIQVGERADSTLYIKQKKLFGESIGVVVKVEQYSQSVTEEEIISSIGTLNKDPQVTGIIVQLPLPSTCDSQKIIDSIHPDKDVDGLGVFMRGRLYAGDKTAFAPATAQAVIALLEEHRIALASKHILVVGRSYLVGRPVALLALEKNATVTIAHSHTRDITSLSKQADIIVVSAGKPRLVDESWINKEKKQVIVDVGIHKTEQGVCGDVDTDAVARYVQALSPVPGGVGPLTVAYLFKNVCKAFKIQHTM